MTISFNHVSDTITLLNATTGANTANNLGGIGTLNVSSNLAVTPAIGVNSHYIKSYYPDNNSPTSELYGIFPRFNIKFVNGASNYNQFFPIQIYDGSSSVLGSIGFQFGGPYGDPKLSTTIGGSFIIDTGQAASAGAASNVNGDFVVRTRGATRFRLSSNGEAYLLGNTTNIVGTTTSNSNTTGTLIVTGGVGIQGNLYTGGVYITGASNGITFADGTTQTTSASLIPQNPQTTDYILQSTDIGKHIYYTQATSSTLYIPPYSSVAFANGSTVMIISQTSSSANVTVTPNTGVSLFFAGNSTSASRNVTTYGMATLIQVAANTWFINGTGVV
jgi:hypothetical protein